MKRALFILLILFGAILIFVLKEQSFETYHDTYVKAGVMKSFFNMFAVHLSPKHYLTVGGRTYIGVRGTEPFYLKIPKWDSILFVTDRPINRSTLHIVNLKTLIAIDIDGGTSGFGWEIGTEKKAGEAGTDYIESVESNKVTIVEQSFDWKETLVINRDTEQVEKKSLTKY